MAVNGNGSIRALEKTVSDGRAQIENWESRREMLHVELTRAVGERRELMLKNGDDSKGLSKANERIRIARESVDAIDDSLAVLRARIDTAEVELRDARDQIAREGRSREILAHVDAVQRALDALAKPAADAIEVLKDAGGVVPESLAASRLLASTATQLAEAHQYLIGLLRSAADASLRAPRPNPAAVAVPVPPPNPRLAGKYRGLPLPAQVTVPELPPQSSGTHEPRPRWGER
jgi:chromosome segregation ATPase